MAPVDTPDDRGVGREQASPRGMGPADRAHGLGGTEADRALLAHPPAARTWAHLQERHPDLNDLGAACDLDSIEWAELAGWVGQHTGALIDDRTIARIGAVRDLLTEVAGRPAGGRGRATTPLAEPEKFLDPTQRNHLADHRPSALPAARAMFALNRLLFRVLFRLRTVGLDNLPARGPFVIAPNHLSYLDGPAVGASLPYQRLRATGFIAWGGASLTNPATRLISRLGRVVPIDADHAPLSALAAGAALLTRGKALVWFPAGRRSPDGTVQPLEPGIGALVAHFRVPVVPVVIDGSRRVRPPGRRVPRPARITVTFGPALSPAELVRAGSGGDDGERIVTALHDRLTAMHHDRPMHHDRVERPRAGRPAPGDDAAGTPGAGRER